MPNNTSTKTEEDAFSRKDADGGNRAELNLRKKLSYMIRVFAKDYFAVLVADFARDRVEISSISEPVVPLLSQTLQRNGTYQGFLEFYSRQYICLQDRDAFLAALAPAEVRRCLSASGTFTISAHHMYQERDCPSEITFIDVSDARDGSECIIAARFLEDIVRQQYALKKQDDMVKTLVQDYNAIYHIDLDTDTFMILQAHNVVNEDLYDYAYRSMPFQAAMRKFVNEMVREEDREIMLKLSSCEYMKERLQREEGYSYRYQVTPRRGMQYFEMRIVRARTDEKGHFAIMTARNVDETAREELRSQREIEKANRELAQALETAENASRSKSEFLSRMSHDIRTPMNAIIGLTAIAGANLGNQEKLEDCLKKISDSSHYLLGVINDILDMSKIESGNMEIREASFSLQDMIRDVLDMVGPQMQARGQSLAVHAEGLRHEQVIGDRGHLEQAFVNILDNAVKYTPEGGHIEFSAEERETSGDRVSTFIFTFRDNGIGMSAEFLKHVFEPFEREEDLRVSKVQGTGLGMAITQHIIHAMGGTVTAESERGRGSCFTVVLPLKLPETAGAGLKPGAAEARRGSDLHALQQECFRGKRILLAEDNEINRDIMTEIICTTQADVETAPDGAAAVKMFSDHPEEYYDLIFMDIQMPRMNGYEAARAIRALKRTDAASVPIVAMTANTFDDDIHEAMQAGMNAHLAKPVSLDRLDEILRKWLLRPEPQK